MEIEANLDAKPYRYGIVVARFNEFITKSLFSGALSCLNRHGAKSENIITAHVPGTFEIPFAVKKLLQTQKLNALITLGVVIQGATSHHLHIASSACSQLHSIGLENNIPVSLGILTCETIEQAIERAGSKCGNKGHEAALAAIEMANLYHMFECSKSKLN